MNESRVGALLIGLLEGLFSLTSKNKFKVLTYCTLTQKAANLCSAAHGYIYIFIIHSYFPHHNCISDNNHVEH
jgi:hypothetical protein